MSTCKGKPRRGFGSIRQLKSGRYQARYSGPDGKTVNAPDTFAKKLHAEAWLVDRKREADLALCIREQSSPRRCCFPTTWRYEDPITSLT